MERTWSIGAEGIEVVFMFEGQFDGLEFGLGTGREVGDGPVFDFAVFAEGLTEEDAAIGFAVGGGLRAVEIHSEHIVIITMLLYKHNLTLISGYTFACKLSLSCCPYTIYAVLRLELPF